MRIARYSTERGAQRYADELLAKFPGQIAAAWPRMTPDFSYGVLLILNNGRHAMAGQRPVRFSSKPVSLERLMI